MVNLKRVESSVEDANGESTSTWSSSKPTRASRLGRAHEELFRRSPDERFSSLTELHEHCRQEKQFSTDTWQLPQTLRPRLINGELSIALESDADGLFNDWSFSQMCRMRSSTTRQHRRIQNTSWPICASAAGLSRRDVDRLSGNGSGV